MTTAHGQKRAAAGAGGALTLSFLGSAESIASTITIPAGVQDGDVAILFDAASGSSDTNGVPSGWTGAIVQGPISSESVQISYKILASSDASASITGLDGLGWDKVMLVFRGSSAISAVSSEDWALELTAGDPSSQTVNASGQTAPLVVFGVARVNSGTAAFSTASPAFDGMVANSDADMLVGYKIYNAAPADHSIDMGDIATRVALGSGFLEMS
jgi:hypothetical protein